MTTKTTRTAKAAAVRTALDHDKALVIQLADYRQMLAELKTTERQIAARLTAIIEAAGATVGTLAGVDAVRVDYRSATSIDREAVAELIGGAEYLPLVTRESPFTAVSLVGQYRAR